MSAAFRHLARRRPWPLVAAMALGLAACSGGQGDGVLTDGSQFAGLDEVLRRAPRATDTPPLVVLAAPGAAQGVLAAELPARDARATLRVDGRNRQVTTWRTQDDVSLALADPGVLIATRGLGDDLHIADAAETRAALSAGRGGEVRRSHVRVGADQRTRSTAYRCTLAPAGPETVRLGDRQRPTQRWEETCSGPDGGFTNLYWRDPARPIVWQSEQWIGPELGSIRLQLIVD